MDFDGAPNRVFGPDSAWRAGLGHFTLLVIAFLLLVPASAPAAAERADAQVIMVVDTSGSMKEPGMDPERASLLVSRLYADIVPGELAVIRLLDLTRDRAVLRSSPTPREVPCDESPTDTCRVVDQLGNWGEEARTASPAARAGYGVEIRQGQSDAVRFKLRLDPHLLPTAGNSLFDIAFRSAEGMFEETRRIGARPQFLIWLSDGRPNNKEAFLVAARALVRQGVVIEPLLVGRGDDRVAKELNLPAMRVDTPATTMSAFADIFRRIVHAPFRTDGVIAVQPGFQMLPHVREAWVVVYGDDSLTAASISGPAGYADCNFAADRVPRAGAYRVARVEMPSPGPYTVKASGGGRTAAYAVIQNLGLRVVYLGPADARAGREVALIVGVETDDARATRVSDPAVLAGLTVEITGEGGKSISLFDDGTHGDTTAGDGQYTGTTVFLRPADLALEVRAKSDSIDAMATASLKVLSDFTYDGGPVLADFGQVAAGQKVCVPLIFRADVPAPTPVTAKGIAEVPSGHDLLVRAQAVETPLGQPFILSSGLPVELCLDVDPLAPSSLISDAPLVELRSDGGHGLVPITVRWVVTGKPIWQRYLRSIVAVLLGLAALFIVYGFIWPGRFERRLGVVLAETPDLDQGAFYAFRQFRRTGAGWYRHAVAHLFENYRISGRAYWGIPRGAAVRFQARRSSKSIKLCALSGQRLEWLNADGEWESLPDGEQIAVFARTYRIANASRLYFAVRKG